MANSARPFEALLKGITFANVHDADSTERKALEDYLFRSYQHPFDKEMIFNVANARKGRAKARQGFIRSLPRINIKPYFAEHDNSLFFLFQNVHATHETHPNIFPSSLAYAKKHPLQTMYRCWGCMSQTGRR